MIYDVSSLLKLEYSLNPLNSKGKSEEDFVWEIKSNSIQNYAWIGAVNKTEVVSNPEQYGDYWTKILKAVGIKKNIGKYKIGSVGDDN